MNSHAISRLFLIGLLVLAVGAQAGIVAADAQPGESGAASIERVRTPEAVDVAGNPDTTYVWSTTEGGEPVSSHPVAIEVTSVGNTTEVCLQNSCRVVDNGTARTVVAFETTEDGPTNATVVLRNASSGAQLDAETVRLHEIDRDGNLDGDGVNNSLEAEMGTNVVEADTDNDGLDDGRELREGTDPLAADSDGDGLDDPEELQRGTDPLKADTDDDGLLDGEELQRGTDPLKADSDGDGLLDGKEIREGTDPLQTDTDGDGLNDSREVAIGTDPTRADSDGDGLDDLEELQQGTDPLEADTDDDGLLDGEELQRGTDPLKADTDGDGLPDGEEIREGTDPLQADTDGDYLTDGVESRFGLDPTNPLTPAWGGAAVFGFLSGIGVSVMAINRRWTTAAARAVEPYLYRLPLVGPTEIELDEVPEASPDEDGADSPPDTAPTATSATEVVEQVDTELTPDGELVERMLEAEDGRMRQSAIVEHTEWSKSKVSRLLSRMDDDDDVTKVSLGRENLVCLAGSVPEIAYPETTDRTGLSRLHTATSK